MICDGKIWDETLMEDGMMFMLSNCWKQKATSF
jgi:hypothetical protein